MPPKNENKWANLAGRINNLNWEKLGIAPEYQNDIITALTNLSTKRVCVMTTISDDEDPTNPPCIVSNVVSYVVLNMRQNQKKTALYGKKVLPCYFDPKIFAFSQQPFCANGYPPVKVLFFSGNRCTIVGGLSESHNRFIAWSMVRYLRKIAPGLELENFSTKNIVANVSMPFKINLEAIAENLAIRAIFTPGDIECCRVKSRHEGSMVFLIFQTGSILLIGCKNMNQLELLYAEVCEVAKAHRITEPINKTISQKYKRKHELLNPETIETTNLEIVNAMQSKKQKAMKGKSAARIKLEMDHFDSIYGPGPKTDSGDTEKQIEFSPEHRSKYLEYNVVK